MVPHRPLGLLRPLATITKSAQGSAVPQRRRGLTLSWRRITRPHTPASAAVTINQSWPVTITLHCRTHVVLHPAARPAAMERFEPRAPSPTSVLRLQWMIPDLPARPAMTTHSPQRSMGSAPSPMEPEAPHSRSRRLPRHAFPSVAITWPRSPEVRGPHNRSPHLAAIADTAVRRDRSPAPLAATHVQGRDRVAHRVPHRAALMRRERATGSPFSTMRRTPLDLVHGVITMRPLFAPAQGTLVSAPGPARPAAAAARIPLRLIHRGHAPAEQRSSTPAGRKVSADLVWADRSSGAMPGFATAFAPAFPAAPAPAATVIRPAPPAPPPPAARPDVDRLVDEVMRRIERHNRSEKLRRGL